MRLTGKYSVCTMAHPTELNAASPQAGDVKRASVLMQRTELQDRWQSVNWKAVSVEEDARPALSSPRLVGSDGSVQRWLWTGFELRLFKDEAEGYWLNADSDTPFVWVNFDDEEEPAKPLLLMLSYNEAGRIMDGGGKVDGVPMPPQWLPWLRAFVEQHYKPEPGGKRRARPPSFKGAKRDQEVK